MFFIIPLIKMQPKYIFIFLTIFGFGGKCAEILNGKVPVTVTKSVSSDSSTDGIEARNASNILTASEIDPSVSPSYVATNVTAALGNVNSENEVAAAATQSEAEIPSEDVNPVNVDDINPINKFCKCSETSCNCCRNLQFPFIPIRGPGCAKIQYLGNEKMAVTIKYGDIVLASRTVSSRKSPPICMPLPGGFSQFCGKIYGLAKEKNHFKACLGFELRAEDEIEAALRVSCFRFGSQGFSVAEAEPLPPPEDQKDEEDDDDFLGFGAGDDDEEDDENESTGLSDDDNDDDDNTQPDNNSDYGEGFSALGGEFLEEIFDDDNSNKRKRIASINSETKSSPKDEDDDELSLFDDDDDDDEAEDDDSDEDSTSDNTVPSAKSNSLKKRKRYSDTDYIELLAKILENFR